MDEPVEDPRRELRRLAERQHSVVAVRQAVGLGLTLHQIRQLVRTERWTRWSRKVIRLAGAPMTNGVDLMASVLDAGAGAAVSGRAAAVLWQIPEYRLHRVELAVPRRASARSGERYDVARLTHLTGDLITDVSGIPVLRLAPVLFQLAAFEQPDKMLRLLSNVGRRSPGTIAECHRLLDVLAKSGRAGVATMRTVLAEFPVGGRWVASNLERRFEKILGWYHELPLTRQVDVGGHDWLGRTDYADLDLKALFEVQSEAYHSSPADVAADERRIEALLAAGWRAVEAIEEDWIWHDPRRAVAVVRDTRRRLRSEPA